MNNFGLSFVLFILKWSADKGFLDNLKNLKNTHGGMLQSVKLKVTLFHGCFSRFLNCTNGTKSQKVPHIEIG